MRPGGQGCSISTERHSCHVITGRRSCHAYMRRGSRLPRHHPEHQYQYQHADGQQLQGQHAPRLPRHHSEAQNQCQYLVTQAATSDTRKRSCGAHEASPRIKLHGIIHASRI